MSKKRTSPEPSDDENEDPDVSPHVAKRPKLHLSGDTKLQDLPIELLECILVKAVVMEVKDMKLAKSVWKAKADLVISRLLTVCSQWSGILTSDVFRTKVHRILDDTAPETIRLEILQQQSPIQSELGISKVIAMKDEIFMLYRRSGKGDAINVYNRNNVLDVKDVIPLPGIHVSPMGFAACNVSNSLYAIDMRWQEASRTWQCLSVWRITREAEHQYHTSPWLSDLKLPLSYVSVSANGSVIILTESNPSVVRTYNANASLQHEIVLSLDIRCFIGDDKVLQKSNGNLVLFSHARPPLKFETILTEIDITGRIIRRYNSSVGGGFTTVKFADAYERILISDLKNRMELLDSEFNHLDFTFPQLAEGKFDITHHTYYNIGRNEMVGVAQVGGLTIFRFTAE